MLRKVTVSLDEDTARWVRIEAARRGTSVSRLIGEILRGHMAAETSYEEAMAGFLSEPPVPLKKRGERYPAREALHDRAGLR